MKEAVEARAKAKGESEAVVVREALTLYLETHRDEMRALADSGHTSYTTKRKAK